MSPVQLLLEIISSWCLSALIPATQCSLSARSWSDAMPVLLRSPLHTLRMTTAWNVELSHVTPDSDCEMLLPVLAST